MKNIENNPFNFWSVDYNSVPAFIAHYMYQSEETYFNRKINLPLDTHSSNVFREVEQNIHKDFNDVDNFLVKNKYAERVRHFLNIANNVTISDELKEQLEEQLDSVNELGTTLQESLNNETLQNDTQ